MKKFKPPTKQEMIDYARKRNLDVNADKLWDIWSEGEWIKSNGKPIHNWKQTMLVHDMINSKHDKVFVCCKCSKKPAPYVEGRDRDGHTYHYCHWHKPKPPPLTKAMQEMTEPISKIPPEKKPEPVYKLRKRMGL